MRRLARDLGVQPGALYWHVKNKQELLGVLSVMILAPAGGGSAVLTTDAMEADPTEADGGPLAGLRDDAQAIRTALLQVRDGAEVVALTHALEPDALPAFQGLSAEFAAAGLAAAPADWAGRALIHYILGTVAEEQTRSGLMAAGVLPGSVDPAAENATFDFGLDLLLAGAAQACAAPAQDCAVPAGSPGE